MGNTYYVWAQAPSPSDAYTTAQAQNVVTPWATLANAMANVAAGDIVRVVGAQTLASIIGFTTAGVSASPITIQGYGLTAPNDGANAIIDGNAAVASLFDVTAGSPPAAAGYYYLFKNLLMENATGTLFNGTGKDHLAFDSCEIAGAANGILGQNNVQVANCSIHDITGYGVTASVYGGAWNNTVYNVNKGFVSTTGFAVLHNRIWGLTANGIGIQATTSGQMLVAHNVVDGGNSGGTPVTGTIGIRQVTSSGPMLLRGNIVINCVTGLLGSASPYYCVGGYNVYHGCTTKRTNAYAWSTDLDDVDPQFVDRANRDYRLRHTSPARRMGGTVNMFAGAIPPELAVSRMIEL